MNLLFEKNVTILKQKILDVRGTSFERKSDKWILSERFLLPSTSVNHSSSYRLEFIGLIKKEMAVCSSQSYMSDGYLVLYSCTGISHTYLRVLNGVHDSTSEIVCGFPYFI